MFLGYLPGQFFMPGPLPPGIPTPSPPVLPPPPPTPGLPGSGFLPKILGPLGGAFLDILFNPAPTQNEDDLLKQLNNPANGSVGFPIEPGNFTQPPPEWGYNVNYMVWGMGKGDGPWGPLEMEGVVAAGAWIPGPITGFSSSPPFGVYDKNGFFWGCSHPHYFWGYVTSIIKWRFQTQTAPSPWTPQPLDPPLWEITFPWTTTQPGDPPIEPFAPLPPFVPGDPIDPNNPFSPNSPNPYAPPGLPQAPPVPGLPPIPGGLPGNAGNNQLGGTAGENPQAPYEPGLIPPVFPIPIVIPGTNPTTNPQPQPQPQPNAPPPLLPVNPTTNQNNPPGGTNLPPGTPVDKPPQIGTPGNLAPDLIPDPTQTPDVVTQKPPLPQDDCCDEILAQLAIVQQKLGDFIPEGISAACESLMLGSATNRYLIMNTLSVGLHNAAMLSPDLPQTLLPSATFFLNQPSFHFIKGDETKIIPLFTAAKSAEGTFQAGLATGSLALLHPKYQDENRITIVGSNLFKNLVVLFESVMSFLAGINQTLARLGNRLIRNGTIEDDDETYYADVLEIFSPDFGMNIIPFLGGMILKAVNGKNTLNNDVPINNAPVPEILTNKAQTAAQVAASKLLIDADFALSEAVSTTPNIEIEDIW